MGICVSFAKLVVLGGESVVGWAVVFVCGVDAWGSVRIRGLGSEDVFGGRGTGTEFERAPSIGLVGIGRDPNPGLGNRAFEAINGVGLGSGGDWTGIKDMDSGDVAGEDGGSGSAARAESSRPKR